LSLPSSFPNLRVADHPLIRHKLTQLRSRDTPTALFARLVEEITLLLAYEATRDLATAPLAVETPLEAAEGEQIRGAALVLVPILRAGLGMVEPLRRLIPDAGVGHLGLYRDEQTLEPVEYFVKLPPGPTKREFLILDPMLATGGSAAAAVALLRARGAARVRILCLVAAPEGVGRMAREHPDVTIHAAALDRQLDGHGYIRPGLGDAGDRLFGTS
jgi:uracil phosphoribosyltransferase